ncbi:hypothetical protein SAMN05443144_13025 [Fodinibius roseus]|uniref:Uncharacterized protein n=1 Tax=Fodinibius roseus TaxID=1194090 RepID=A0A1M5K9S8_9BACT|nr:hypothetical protein [Fodinibius roseus]SHG49249.1 hypothetical protein SAMN05443144_13025 [Fodinibius roseus]
MATPIKRKYHISNEQLFELVDDVVEKDGLYKIGERRGIGLLSIDIGKVELLYLHIVQKEGISEISASTGLSFMKDRPQSDLPIKTINSFLQKLEKKMK